MKKGLGSVGNIKCCAFERMPTHCTFQIASKFAQFKGGFFLTPFSPELNSSLWNFTKSSDICSVPKVEMWVFMFFNFVYWVLRKHLVVDTALNRL